MSASEYYAIIIIPIVISILAALPGLLALRKSKTQKARERADTITSLQALVDKQSKDWQEQHDLNRKLQGEIDALRDEVECWRDVFDMWKTGISRLVDQVGRLGEEPEWQPGEDDLDCLKKTIAKGIKK
jgi:hypothetical protein